MFNSSPEYHTLTGWQSIHLSTLILIHNKVKLFGTNIRREIAVANSEVIDLDYDDNSDNSDNAHSLITRKL
jgi:hypothetical protein